MANFSNDVWMASTGAASFYPHSIDQSLRFADGDSAMLDNSADPFASDGNLKTWTWSCWVKRAKLGAYQSLWSSGTNNNNRDYFAFDANDNLVWIERIGGTVKGQLVTVAKYRDVSAWYNLTIVRNTDNVATADDRLKIYVNGVIQEESITNHVDNNHEAMINRTNQHNIGSRRTDADDIFFDGYMADVVFVDGSALGPDSFGELKDGIWVAKDVSGLTFGQNGFHLDFSDSSAIGNDVSGKNNDFAPSGGGSPTLVASDVVPDSPTNNFATLNPLNNPDGTFSEGNLKWTSTTTDQRIALATMPVDSLGTDDSYAEVRIGSKSSTYWAIGVFGNPKSWNPRVMYRSDGVINRDGTDTQTGVGTFTEGDIMSITYDVSSGTVTFYKNNSSVTTETVGDTDNVQYFGCTSDSSGSSANYNWNFGQDSSFAGNETAQGNADANGQGDFYYTPPTGLALCSANLPEPSIISGEDYFNTVLYTGNGGTQSITGVNFESNFTWIKRRDSTNWHMLYDSVRGAGKSLNSNENNAEFESTTRFTSFDSDGFTVGNDANTNSNTRGYVSWNWLAGTAVSGATTGSGTAKTYTGSVNTESGFSIIKYVGNGTAGHTIPHNLTVDGVATTPTMIMVKRLDAAGGWRVQHKDVASTHYLALDTNAAKADLATIFNDTAFNSTVFTVGSAASINSNDAASSYIAYCFTDIDQYCKAGSYTGLNTSDNTYVHLGFRPAWVMCKSYTQGGSGYDWVIYDNKRSPTNPVGFNLEANNNIDDESVRGVPIDFLSNGFKIRNSYGEVGSNKGYIYLAFAESPFKYSNAK